MKTLKDFGFGKRSLEETVNIEIEELIQRFKASEVRINLYVINSKDMND